MSFFSFLSAQRLCCTKHVSLLLTVVAVTGFLARETPSVFQPFVSISLGFLVAGYSGVLQWFDSPPGVKPELAVMNNTLSASVILTDQNAPGPSLNLRAHLNHDPHNAFVRSRTMIFGIWCVRELLQGRDTEKPFFFIHLQYYKSRFWDWGGGGGNTIGEYLLYYAFCCVWPPLWSSGQSSWLQIRRPGFDSRQLQEENVVGLERGPLRLVSTTEELLDRKVAAPV
jgi:hypothetical protein